MGEPFIGSAAVALHGGGPLRVADVDVLLSLGDAAILLPEMGLPLHRGACHPLFRSEVFGACHGATLPVEFMAGFAYRGPEGWNPVAPDTRERVIVGERALFVPARKDLRALLAAFGRPKDRVRAAEGLEIGDLVSVRLTVDV